MWPRFGLWNGFGRVSTNSLESAELRPLNPPDLLEDQALATDVGVQ